MSEHQEVWREVPGFPGYDVSNQGRVRSWKRTKGAPKLLAMSTRKAIAYKEVGLFADGKTSTKKVHALVLLAFVGPRPEGSDVRHLDGDPQNNHLSNLTYGTRLENMQDAIRHGSFARRPRKTHCPQGHEYTPDNVYPTRQGWRRCATCYLARQKEYGYRVRAAKRVTREKAA